jgi:hypothetical protein
MTRCNIIVLVVAAIISGGCTSHANWRVFKKHNLVATAPIERGRALFPTISIGTPEMPYDGTIEFSVCDSNGHVVMSRSFDVKAITTEGHRTRSANELGREWPVGPFVYLTSYGAFIVDDARILYWNPGGVVESIGNASGTKLYKFPLTEEQLTEIFGTPDEVIDKWLW